MTDFLASQTDYALFLGGVGFAIAATHSVSLWRLGNEELPWKWLAAFSMLWVAVSWSQTVGLVYTGPDAVGYVETILAAAAYLILVQFWREGFRRQVGWTQGRWILVPPAVLIIVGIVGGQLALSAVVSYLLGIVSALAGAAALASLARNTEGPARSRLYISASALFLYGVFGVWTSPPEAVFPMSTLNAATFVGTTGVPVEVLRTIAALVFSWQLGAYMQRVNPLWFDADAGPGLRHLGGVIALAMVTALAAGALVTHAFGQDRLSYEQDQLLVEAQLAAAALDPSGIVDLTGTLDDVGTPEYELIQSQLTAVREVAPDATFVYLMIMRDGQAVILVEGTPVEGEGPEDLPGTVYEEASEELLIALQSPYKFVEGPLADIWGTWYSGFAPVYANDGSSLALLGIDREASHIDQQVAAARMNGILISLGVAILILTLWSAVQLTRTWAARVAGTERRFRQMFDNAPEGIFIMSMEERTIRVANPYMVTWLGYSMDELSSVPIESIVVSGLEGIAQCLADLSGPDECAIKHDCQYRRKDGGIVDVGVTAVPTVYKDESAVLVYARDMTESHTAQRVLEYRARFNDLVVEISTGFINVEPEHVDQGIEHALDGIGAFVGADRAYVMMLSSDGESMSNTHEWASLGALSRKEALQDIPVDQYPHIVTTIAGGKDVIIDDIAGSTDLGESERESLLGHDVRSVCAVPMMWRTKLIGFLGFDAVGRRAEWNAESTGLLRIAAFAIVNAMERKRASIEVRRLSQAIEQSPVAVIITDPSGAIEYVNRKFTELTGYSMAEVKGQNPRILNSGFTPHNVYKELWETVLAGEPWQGEFINKTKAGLNYYASATISAMRDYSGEISRFISVQEDITTIKQAEEALVTAKMAAEDANRAKSEFLAAMSHEIRTPMNAIIGMGELLEETDLDPRQARYVGIFKSAGDALLALINDVLDLSKIEAGRFEIDSVRFELEELVERTASVLGVKAREKGLELLFRIEPGTPTNVVGDPDRLRQVLINLMGNAIKFTGEGQVLVSVACERQGIDANGDIQGEYRFSVADTGIGIAPEKLDLVFESFTQADSSTTRQYGGTGLGLTISRRLVELMGGSLRVASEVGEGTTFSFDVPLRICTADAAEGAGLVSELNGLHVLVVDDNATNRLIVSEMLGRAGVTVDEAPDAMQGLEMTRHAVRSGSPYDVIILDNHMPEMSGVHFAEKAKADPEISSTGMIMLSSDQMPETGIALRELGVSDYLTKPVRRVDLESAVASASHRAREAAREALGQPVSDVPAQGTALRVLVAEDSEDNRFLLEAHLSKTSHEVVMVENGAEAVEAFAASPGGFDLVLMDMQMPVMDGYQATRKIREFERDSGERHTPVVALTAYALKEEIQKSLDAGCDGHLMKPIKKAVLLEAIESYGRGATHE
ncbi:MAG: response regulator [Coriobacteriia bacterium]|nr:response regulator [Coriobacteriia bacterium]